MATTGLVQYEGFDALARILAGDVVGRINAMYFQFDYNGPGTARGPIDRTTTSADFRALSGDLDFLRVPLQIGALSASDSLYSSNQVTLTGVANIGDVGVGDEGHTLAAGSAIELIAAVIAPDWGDKTKDLVYAAYAPDAPIIIPATGGLAFRWTLPLRHEAL